MPGLVKTRLVPPLTHAEAAGSPQRPWLTLSMLPPPASATVSSSPSTAPAPRGSPRPSPWSPNEVRTSRNASPTPGRMPVADRAHAPSRSGWTPTQVQAADLDAAFLAVESPRADTALGLPWMAGGGCWRCGGRPGVFAGVPMSTRHAGAAQLAALEARAGRSPCCPRCATSMRSPMSPGRGSGPGHPVRRLGALARPHPHGSELGMRMLVTGGAGSSGRTSSTSSSPAGTRCAWSTSLSPAAHRTRPGYLDPNVDYRFEDLATPGWRPRWWPVSTRCVTRRPGSGWGRLRRRRGICRRQRCRDRCAPAALHERRYAGRLVPRVEHGRLRRGWLPLPRARPAAARAAA